MAILRDSDGIAHVVGISGGKDSVALATALQIREPRPYTFVMTPTGDELPEMIAHIVKVERILGQPVVRLTNGTLASVIEQNNMLPNFRARFCTRILKLRPYGKFMAEAAPAISYIGLRADEDEREGARPGGDYAAQNTKVTQDFPFQRWGWDIDAVWAWLDALGIAIPERTDCARCPYQKLGEWYVLWRDHRAIYFSAEADERKYSHTFRSQQRDSWPASLTELRLMFEAGKKPETSLRMMESRKGMCRACSL